MAIIMEICTIDRKDCCCYVCICRLGSPFAVHVSRDVSNTELRATLLDCMQDMFKDSAFSQVNFMVTVNFFRAFVSL